MTVGTTFTVNIPVTKSDSQKFGSAPLTVTLTEVFVFAGFIVKVLEAVNGPPLNEYVNGPTPPFAVAVKVADWPAQTVTLFIVTVGRTLKFPPAKSSSDAVTDWEDLDSNKKLEKQVLFKFKLVKSTRPS